MRKVFFAAVILAAVLFSSRAYSETCDCDISQDKVTAYNALLSLCETEKADAARTHLPWGAPKNSPTGLDFLPLLEKETSKEAEVESRVSKEVWVG